MKIFSQIISYLFHPMLMPTLGLFFILSAGTHISYLPFEMRRLIYIIVFSSTCLLPVSLLPLFLQFRVIKSFQMQTASERTWPLLTSGLFFLLGYYLLIRLHIPALILNFFLASLIAVLIALVVSLYWKMSLHMLALGGVTAMLVAMALRFGIDLVAPLSFMLLASGVTGTARLFLNVHSPAQVYTGYLTGFVVVLSGSLI